MKSALRPLQAALAFRRDASSGELAKDAKDGARSPRRQSPRGEGGKAAVLQRSSNSTPPDGTPPSFARTPRTAPCTWT